MATREFFWNEHFPHKFVAPAVLCATFFLLSSPVLAQPTVTVVAPLSEFTTAAQNDTVGDDLPDPRVPVSKEVASSNCEAPSARRAEHRCRAGAAADDPDERELF